MALRIVSYRCVSLISIAARYELANFRNENIVRLFLSLSRFLSLLLGSAFLCMYVCVMAFSSSSSRLFIQHLISLQIRIK